MSRLQEQLHDFFESGDQYRGRQYFYNGRVKSLAAGDEGVDARVIGSSGSYEVSIQPGRSDDDYQLSCSCQRFSDGFPCKHLWAAVLAADKMRQGNPKVVPAGPAETQENGHASPRKKPVAAAWRAAVKAVHRRSAKQSTESPRLGRAAEQLIYLITIAENGARPEQAAFELNLMKRNRLKSGDWSKASRRLISWFELHALPTALDRGICRQLINLGFLGDRETYGSSYGFHKQYDRRNSFEVTAGWPPTLIEDLLQSGRLYWALDSSLPFEDFQPLTEFDLQPSCDFRLQLDPRPGSRDAELRVVVDRSGEPLPPECIVQCSPDGILLTTSSLLRVSNPHLQPLWAQAAETGAIPIPSRQINSLITELSRIPGLGSMEFLSDWGIQHQSPTPQPVLKLTRDDNSRSTFSGSIFFDYETIQIAWDEAVENFFDLDQDRWVQRNRPAEQSRLDELAELPVIQVDRGRDSSADIEIAAQQLMTVVKTLGDAGWLVRLKDRPIRYPGEVNVQVAANQDWFDMNLSVDFEGTAVSLPSLLRAVEDRQNMVTLADGSIGYLPHELIEKYAGLARLGKIEGEDIRFGKSQALLLDAFISTHPRPVVDQDFDKFCGKLKSFSGIKPKAPPRGFQGSLRDYQQDGLAWLHFLQGFGFGGCLADDMGLGKTIQILALLESRRTRRLPTENTDIPETTDRSSPLDSDPAGVIVTEEFPIVAAARRQARPPSIVVVPKSLIFNWIEEAARFTPRLRILNYTGVDRNNTVESIDRFDVILTTYATMTRDIPALSQIRFDYAILDEAQAIKNSKTKTARASLLLDAEHRLAMTGTPIENHIGELWSMFEFLNPGMLGLSSHFNRLVGSGKANPKEREEALELLARAISPLVLRRTKQQVLADLPEKTEQTLYCDMEPAQKKKYNELKEYYRSLLDGKIKSTGLGRAKIHVLEALLRLRQAACDPRLLDPKAKPGAKLLQLQEQIGEVVDEGHKVLVFSQFTSLLDLIQRQFDRQGIRYEYLDGQTRDRQQRVENFQNNPEVKAFLISLKAGGQGLNLTAADYVYLLDPWWNPAVEAQAIDRAHRMGQQNPVIAYRMICRDTVEEKILKLQDSKRELADSIIRADESLIQSLTAEDLELLLS